MHAWNYRRSIEIESIACETDNVAADRLVCLCVLAAIVVGRSTAFHPAAIRFIDYSGENSGVHLRSHYGNRGIQRR
jgi:hypothetical protein